MADFALTCCVVILQCHWDVHAIFDFEDADNSNTAYKKEEIATWDVVGNGTKMIGAGWPSKNAGMVTWVGSSSIVTTHAIAGALPACMFI
jgi:hypothetical protein